MSTRALAPLAVVLVAIATVVLVVSLRPARELTLVFDEVLGLPTGAEVHVGGERVGEVEAVELGRDGYPRVRITIDDDVPARAGARATLRLFSAPAEERRYIALEPGNGPALPNGAVLGRAATDGPVESDSALSTLNPATRRDVTLLLDRADRTLRRRGPALDRTLAHSADALSETATLVGEVNSDGEALRTVVRDGRRVVGALADRRDAVGATVDGLATALTTTARRNRELSATLAALPVSLRTARSALERVDGATPELTALARALRPGVRELVPTTRTLRPTLRVAEPALSEGRRLVAAAPADLRPLDALLREVQPLLEPTRSVLIRANPMLDELRVRTPELAGFVTNWADAASNYDANGHGLRTALVFAEPPRNRVGPSEAEPGQLVEPYTRTPGVLEGEPWRSYRESFIGGGP